MDAMNVLGGLAIQSIDPWLSRLGDTQPFDLAISCCFVLALLAVLAAALRDGLLVTERLRWLAVGVIVAALLVNQQGDFHTRLIAEAHASADIVDAVLGHSVTLEEARGGLALSSLAAGLLILGLSLRGRPPGWCAGAGLLLLLLHATARGAMLVGVVGDGPRPEALALALKTVEVAGLALVGIGALRWRRSLRDPAPAPGQPAPPSNAAIRNSA